MAKVKAAMNIALSKERKGDLENSFEWINKGYKLLMDNDFKGPVGLVEYVMVYYHEMSLRKLACQLPLL